MKAPLRYCFFLVFQSLLFFLKLESVKHMHEHEHDTGEVYYHDHGDGQAIDKFM